MTAMRTGSALSRMRGLRRPMRMLLAALLSVSLVPHPVHADDRDDAARAFAARDYARAVALYRRIIADGDASAESFYNLGTALVRADSVAAAREPLERAAQLATGTTPAAVELRYRALFNLGFAHLREGLAAPGDAGRPALDAALAAYKRVLLARAGDVDAKWNYELALKAKQKSGGGGGGGGGGGQAPQPQPDPSAQPQAPVEQPRGGLGQQRAEELLNSAARDEREVQGRKGRQSRVEPPPGGKDW